MSDYDRYMFRPYIRVAKHWFTGAAVKSDPADAVVLTEAVGTTNRIGRSCAATACKPTGTVPKSYRIPKRQGDKMSEGDVSPPQIRAVMASVVHNVSWQTGDIGGGRCARTAGAIRVAASQSFRHSTVAGQWLRCPSGGACQASDIHPTGRTKATTGPGKQEGVRALLAGRWRIIQSNTAGGGAGTL